MYGSFYGFAGLALLGHFMTEAERAERRMSRPHEARTRTMRRCHDYPLNPFTSRQVRRAMEREAEKFNTEEQETTA